MGAGFTEKLRGKEPKPGKRIPTHSPGFAILPLKLVQLTNAGAKQAHVFQVLDWPRNVNVFLGLFGEKLNPVQPAAWFLLWIVQICSPSVLPSMWVCIKTNNIIVCVCVCVSFEKWELIFGWEPRGAHHVVFCDGSPVSAFSPVL